MDLRCHGNQRLIYPNSLTDVFYIALYVLSIPHNVKYEAVQKWRTIKRCEEEVQLLKIEMQIVLTSSLQLLKSMIINIRSKIFIMTYTP